MTDLFVKFCNWYFMTVLPAIPEQFIDLFTLVSFFVVSMLISIVTCSVGYIAFFMIKKLI